MPLENSYIHDCRDSYDALFYVERNSRIEWVWHGIIGTSHERHDVPNHRQPICVFNSLFMWAQKTISKFRFLQSLWGESTGNRWWPVEIRSHTISSHTTALGLLEYYVRWFSIKMASYQYRKSHCGDKTVVRSSYLHNGIFYTGKMPSLYWFRPLVSALGGFRFYLLSHLNIKVQFRQDKCYMWRHSIPTRSVTRILHYGKAK